MTKKEYKVTNDKLIWKMSAKNPPVLRVEPGSVIEFETRDCFGSQKLTPGDGPIVFDPNMAGNPATGPVYVEGAMPGDVLKVKILEITPTSAAVMGMDKTMGVFMHETEIDALRIFDVHGGKTFFGDKYPVPNKPMLGVIGIAPEEGTEIPNMTPGTHGGNMDCKRIIAGSTLYLPVHAEGALLAVGDVHAVMGDGEVAGGGAEVAARVRVQVSVIKDEDMEGPMLLSEGYAMAIVSAEKLDTAAEEATKAMKRFIQKKFKIEHWEACMLLSLVGDLRICQIVDPLRTCRMEVPMEVFQAYGYSFE